MFLVSELTAAQKKVVKQYLSKQELATKSHNTFGEELYTILVNASVPHVQCYSISRNLESKLREIVSSLDLSWGKFSICYSFHAAVQKNMSYAAVRM